MDDAQCSTTFSHASCIDKMCRCANQYHFERELNECFLDKGTLSFSFSFPLRLASFVDPFHRWDRMIRRTGPELRKHIRLLSTRKRDRDGEDGAMPGERVRVRRRFR